LARPRAPASGTLVGRVKTGAGLLAGTLLGGLGIGIGAQAGDRLAQAELVAAGHFSLERFETAGQRQVVGDVQRREAPAKVAEAFASGVEPAFGQGQPALAERFGQRVGQMAVAFQRPGGGPGFKRRSAAVAPARATIIRP